jgi:hypothetical protein
MKNNVVQITKNRRTKMPTQQQLENAVKVLEDIKGYVCIYPLLENSRDKTQQGIDTAISVLQSLLSYEGKGMPEKKDGLHPMHSLRDIHDGYNQAIDDCRLWLQARMPSDLEIEKVLLQFGGDYVKDKATAISALLKERLGMK